ncbi:MAG: PKD domain-containing protein [Candidatus Gracilibacteria bacterium]|jgi:hypothetical protein
MSKKVFCNTLVAILLAFTLSNTALAYDGDLSISTSDIRFSKSPILEGNIVRIYATVSNLSSKDLLGVVRFFDGTSQINGDQAISLFAGKTDDIFVDWAPKSWGTRDISIRIVPWQPEIDNSANNVVSEKIFVEQDTDHDGIKNSADTDMDGDGVSNEEDAFPLNPKESADTDGDGTGNNTDLDDDNDGVPDVDDEMPLDKDETTDTDKDGIGNIKDTDDDNDGVLDTDEERNDLDPLNPDTDTDTVADGQDAFPLNPEESSDTDKDSVGNNTDLDDDNDGLEDTEDEFPLNKAPVVNADYNKLFMRAQVEQTFDASPSYDEDGKIISYEWTIEGQKQEGPSIIHTFEKPGKYNVALKVTDDSGQSTTNQFQVSVLNMNFYTAISLTLIALLLALVILFKYIWPAKKSHKKH